jgi:hypothetical protein
MGVYSSGLTKDKKQYFLDKKRTKNGYLHVIFRSIRNYIVFDHDKTGDFRMIC